MENEKLRSQIVRVALLRFEEEAERKMIGKNQRSQYLNDKLHLLKADMFLMDITQLQDYLMHQKRKLDVLLLKETDKYETFNEIGIVENEMDTTYVSCCNLI